MQKSVLLLCAFTALNTVQLSIAADQKEIDSLNSMMQWLKEDRLGLGDKIEFDRPIVSSSFSNPPPEEASEADIKNTIELLLSVKQSKSPLHITNSLPKRYSTLIEQGDITITACKDEESLSPYSATSLKLGKHLKYSLQISKQIFDLLSGWYQEEQATKKDS